MNIKDAYIHNGSGVVKELQVTAAGELQLKRAEKDASDNYAGWTDVADLTAVKPTAAGTADKVGHKLTFSGGITGDWDGSADKTVAIPTKASWDYDDVYLKLAGNGTTNPMTGTIYMDNVDGLIINSHDKTLNIWEVYGNSGSWASQYGFNLQYYGVGSENDNDLILWAHAQTSTHVEVYRVHQDGSFIFKAAPKVGTNTVYHAGNLTIKTLMGTTAIGDADEPVYWSGSAFVKAGAYPTKSSWNYDDIYLKDLGLDTGNSTDKNKDVSLTNGNVYLKLFKTVNGAESEDSKVKIYGATNVSVTTDSSGDIKITGVDSVSTATTATNLTNAPTINIGTDTNINKISITAGEKTSTYITVPYSTAASNLNYHTQITNGADLDAFHEAAKFKICTWNNFNEENRALLSYPGISNGIILDGGWTSAGYGFQLAIDDDPTWWLALRQKGPSGWSAWKKIPMGDGTNASGTWSIGITGNAGSATYASNVGAAGTAGTDYVTATNVISMYNWYNTITTTDEASDAAINKWNEIIDFLAGVTDDKTLSGLLAGKANSSHNHAASDINSGTLEVARGGTGKSSWTQYGIVYASATDTLAQITVPSTASKTYWLKCVTNGSSVPTYSFDELGTASTHAHDDYVTSITYDSTNKKLQQSKGGGTATDIVTFGSNAFNSTAYLPLTGGTMNNGANWVTINFTRTDQGSGSVGGIDPSGLYFQHTNSEGTQAYMYLKGGDGLRVNGSLVWTSGNDGSGSGLDADTLDGNDASAFSLSGHTHSIITHSLTSYSDAVDDTTIPQTIGSAFGVSSSGSNAVFTYSTKTSGGTRYMNIYWTNYGNSGLVELGKAYGADGRLRYRIATGWSNGEQSWRAYKEIANVEDLTWGNISGKPDIWATVAGNATSYSLNRDSWTNTIDLPTDAGSYVLCLITGNSTLTGVFSIGTSDGAKDEISLHLHGNGARLFARTNGTKLQLSSNDESATSRSVTIKYKRMI